MRTAARLLTRAGTLALVPVLALATPALAATAVTYDCQATPSLGSPQQLTIDASVQADAPATVAAGSTFEVVLTTDPMTVPASAGGYSVVFIRDLRLTVPVPAGSTYGSATLTGGSGLGTQQPTTSVADGVVTVTVPGPIAGGATFQLPTLHLTLTATGATGTTIDTSLGGTSYANPGLTFTATVSLGFFGLDVPTSCYPNPSPTLTSTAIQ
jgi:dehydratase